MNRKGYPRVSFGQQGDPIAQGADAIGAATVNVATTIAATHENWHEGNHLYLRASGGGLWFGGSDTGNGDGGVVLADGESGWIQVRDLSQWYVTGEAGSVIHWLLTA